MKKAVDYFVPLVEACAMGQGAMPNDTANLDSVIPSVSKKEWAEYQGKDPVISRVLHYFSKLSRPPNPTERGNETPEVLLLLREWNRLTMCNGILYRVKEGDEKEITHQLVLPLSQQTVVL